MAMVLENKKKYLSKYGGFQFGILEKAILYLYHEQWYLVKVEDELQPTQKYVFNISK